MSYNVYDKNISDINELCNNKCFEEAKILDTDLVEASYHFGCCPECAKYRGRIFSISGKDKRFPKIPPKKYGCTCQGLTFSPFIFGVSEPLISDFLGHKVNIFDFSNRPFVDDRTEEEKHAYDMRNKEIEIENWYEPYRRRLFAIKDKNKKQYDFICEKFPDIAPKSMGGYTRMKNSNSKNFQKLVEKVKEYGVTLTYTKDELAEIEYLKPFQEEYAKVKGECFRYYQSNK